MILDPVELTKQIITYTYLITHALLSYALYYLKKYPSHFRIIHPRIICVPQEYIISYYIMPFTATAAEEDGKLVAQWYS